MIYPIILYGNEILTKSSNPVNIKSGNHSEIKELIDDLFETMHRAKGIGLSAIQIAIPTRIFVIEAHLPIEEFHIRETFINPVITKKSKELVNYSEGCLSIPGLNALVERPNKINIEYYNAEFKKVTKTYDKLSSRIIQHEMDHLNGELFLSKLNFMWKSLLEDSLDSIKNREIEINYLSK